MSKFIKSLPLVLAVGSLSACASSRSALIGNDNSFGNATHSNIIAHSVEPDPKLKADTYIPADRERMRAAREAYRKGDVKALEPLGASPG